MASLCGGIVSSRRGLLASLWFLVTILTAIAFIVALLFALSAEDNNNNDEDNDQDPEIGVTSRAMAFASLWTAVLATLLAIFGTVVLGWQSPTGQYYTCCAPQVHRTTPLALGSFIGALIMFSNLTLVCSVLFGEFEVLDYQRDDENRNASKVSRSSISFSIMCMFLTVMYASFAALVFTFAQSVLEENNSDETLIPGRSNKTSSHFVGGGYDGYIGGRFDVRRSNNGGFVAPQASEGALT